MRKSNVPRDHWIRQLDESDKKLEIKKRIDAYFNICSKMSGREKGRPKAAKVLSDESSSKKWGIYHRGRDLTEYLLFKKAQTSKPSHPPPLPSKAQAIFMRLKEWMDIVPSKTDRFNIIRSKPQSLTENMKNFSNIQIAGEIEKQSIEAGVIYGHLLGDYDLDNLIQPHRVSEPAAEQSSPLDLFISQASQQEQEQKQKQEQEQVGSAFDIYKEINGYEEPATPIALALAPTFFSNPSVTDEKAFQFYQEINRVAHAAAVDTAASASAASADQHEAGANAPNYKEVLTNIKHEGDQIEYFGNLTKLIRATHGRINAPARRARSEPVGKWVNGGDNRPYVTLEELNQYKENPATETIKGRNTYTY